MRFSQRTTIALVAAGVLLVLAAVSARPLLIAHHRRQMTLCCQSMLGEAKSDARASWVAQLFGMRSSDSVAERYEYHRDQLVQLGELAHTDYVFSHMQDRSPEYQHLWVNQINRNHCPSCEPYAGVSGSFSEPPAPARLQIWCDRKKVGEWQAFLRRVDVPNYRQRFMSAEGLSISN